MRKAICPQPNKRISFINNNDFILNFLKVIVKTLSFSGSWSLVEFSPFRSVWLNNRNKEKNRGINFVFIKIFSFLRAIIYKYAFIKFNKRNTILIKKLMLSSLENVKLIFILNDLHLWVILQLWQIKDL